MISDAQLTKILISSGVKPESALLSGVRDYMDLLLQWNEKISLTSISKPEEIARFHFGESFFAATALSMSTGRLADVGSGAGFPGVPIKMLSSELQLSLIESNAKKAAFLGEVLRKLDLKPAKVLQTRMEGIVDESPAYDFITARAVGDHREILKWARRHLSPAGRLIMFLGSDDAKGLSRQPHWSWNTKAIPGSERRVLLVGLLEQHVRST